MIITDQIVFHTQSERRCGFFCWAEASREDICFGMVVQAQSIDVDFIHIFVLESTNYVTTCMCACVRACSNVSVSVLNCPCLFVSLSVGLCLCV